MSEDLPSFFKGYEIVIEEINIREGEWVAYVRLRAGYEKELLPGRPFQTFAAAHEYAIRALQERP